MCSFIPASGSLALHIIVPAFYPAVSVHRLQYFAGYKGHMQLHRLMVTGLSYGTTSYHTCCAVYATPAVPTVLCRPTVCICSYRRYYMGQHTRYILHGPTAPTYHAHYATQIYVILVIVSTHIQFWMDTPRNCIHQRPRKCPTYDFKWTPQGIVFRKCPSIWFLMNTPQNHIQRPPESTQELLFSLYPPTQLWANQLGFDLTYNLVSTPLKIVSQNLHLSSPNLSLGLHMIWQAPL